MNKSDSIKELAKALSEFQGKCKPVTLNKTVKVTMKTGGSYNFTYATFDHILNTVKPFLKEFGLSFTQLLEKQGTITTVLMHESGEWISTTTEVSSNGSIQDMGGHFSYLKRYALCGILGVIGEEDDDANGSMGNKVEDVKKPVLTLEHPNYKEVVKYLAEGGVWAKVEEKFFIPKELVPEVEGDIARFNDPTGHGISASAADISKKVKKVGA